MKSSHTHVARKDLFQRGIQQGRLTVAEIEEALPQWALNESERWLLYYSLRAAGVEIVDRNGRPVSSGLLPASSAAADASSE